MAAASAARESAIVELDAGIALERPDPLPSAGDMKEDVEHFVSLDACVADHALPDPIVGDAVRSIGYDTLVRDACRVIQALKLKSATPCAEISASALEHRCESLLAMASQQPDKCPWYSAREKELGRDPTCLAVATHDPRMCPTSSEGSTATCEALATGDVSRCAKAGNANATCARELAREHRLLAGEPGTHDTKQPKARLEIHGIQGTPDPPTTDFDLSSSIRGGAVLSPALLGGTRVELARDVESTLGVHSDGDGPHLSATLTLKGDGAVASRVALSVPKAAALSCEDSHCDLVVTVVAKLDPQRGAPLSATLEGTLGRPGATYKVKLRVDTFVRDVVSKTAMYGGQ